MVIFFNKLLKILSQIKFATKHWTAMTETHLGLTRRLGCLFNRHDVLSYKNSQIFYEVKYLKNQF